MRRETWQAWLMLLPALVLLVAFTHWPADRHAHRQPLHHAQGQPPCPASLGIDNYADL